VWLEGLGQLKNLVTSGNLSRDLPACSIMPQPTTLPRALYKVRKISRSLEVIRYLHLSGGRISQTGNRRKAGSLLITAL
jgi:hypothetical protein